ncbi:hypothetical protein EDC96DRAFT_610267 [Choanephora cucurbitarum]|nr:hypothetical protein EDC96DRAFT_610267 [Choanephora cucurbitarum]
MKVQYLAMDDAPIHSSADTEKYICSRGYWDVYLPPSSPELKGWFVKKDTICSEIQSSVLLLQLQQLKDSHQHDSKIMRPRITPRQPQHPWAQLYFYQLHVLTS